MYTWYSTLRPLMNTSTVVGCSLDDTPASAPWERMPRPRNESRELDPRRPPPTLPTLRSVPGASLATEPQRPQSGAVRSVECTSVSSRSSTSTLGVSWITPEGARGTPRGGPTAVLAPTALLSPRGALSTERARRRRLCSASASSGGTSAAREPSARCADAGSAARSLIALRLSHKLQPALGQWWSPVRPIRPAPRAHRAGRRWRPPHHAWHRRGAEQHA